MKRSIRVGAATLAVLAIVGAREARSQTTPPTPPTKLAVGSIAPDFELRGATRYGVLGNPVRLSDFRGQTVVIAFFYKARTKG